MFCCLDASFQSLQLHFNPDVKPNKIVVTSGGYNLLSPVEGNIMENTLRSFKLRLVRSIFLYLLTPASVLDMAHSWPPSH